MTVYNFPYKDAEFLITELLGFDQMCREAGLEDINSELVSAILDEAGRLGSEIIAPLNPIGDQIGATLGEDGVRETPGFADAYRQFVDSGWPSLNASKAYGGQEMPKVLGAAVAEIWQSSSLAFSLCPLLTSGAIEAITAHGSDELKDTYLPNLLSGDWPATMTLTASAAGSDLAAVASRAVPEGEIDGG